MYGNNFDVQENSSGSCTHRGTLENAKVQPITDNSREGKSYDKPVLAWEINDKTCNAVIRIPCNKRDKKPYKDHACLNNDAVEKICNRPSDVRSRFHIAIAVRRTIGYVLFNRWIISTRFCKYPLKQFDICIEDEIPYSITYICCWDCTSKQIRH